MTSGSKVGMTSTLKAPSTKTSSHNGIWETVVVLESGMRKKTKRKVYKLVNPIDYAITGAAITQDIELNKLRLRELSSIDAFSRGLATIDDWQTLTDALNIAETAGKMGVGPEVLPWCKKLTEALLEAAQRYEKIKRFGLSGEGLKASKEVYAFHDLIRKSIARSEYEKIIKKTKDKIVGGSKDVIVLR